MQLFVAGAALALAFVATFALGESHLSELSKVIFLGAGVADLANARFNRANLTGADLEGARTVGADFTGAILIGTILASPARSLTRQ